MHNPKHFSLIALCFAGGMMAYPVQAEVIYSGVASGDATEHSAILWTRTVDDASQKGVAAELTAQVAIDPSFDSIPYTFAGKTNPDRDCIVKLDAQGLQSGTRYYYRFRTTDGAFSPVGTFKTAPKERKKVAVRLAFSGDADGKWRPYGSTQGFNQLNLDYFIFLGDTIYETKTNLSAETADPFANAAQALTDYRRKYLENLQATTPGGFTGLQTLFAAQGNYTLLDNHELGNKQFINGGAPAGSPAGKGVDATDPANDVNTTGEFINKTDGFKALLQAYSDYQPIRERAIAAPEDARTDGTQQLYLAQRWGANNLFINVDDRSYRDIRLKTAAGTDDTGSRADNPERTMLGATQLEWLKQTLKKAQTDEVRWKILAVSSPIDETGDDGGKSWIGGYRKERNELLKFIADNGINNVVFLSADDHQNRINELTYRADPNDPNSRTPVPNAFTIVAGPIGAGGPDSITDHSFDNIKLLADQLVEQEKAVGIDPIGLDPAFPGLKNVVREGDPAADTLRQPVDFFTPDTFNYVTLEINPRGNTLSVTTYGVDSYQANVFPEVAPPRKILSFQIQAAKSKKIEQEEGGE